MIHYFAYGSNLHPVRLQERVPSAELVGTVELKRHCLTFHKKSHDGSSKCNILETGNERHSVHGAIYRMHPAHKTVLDGFEGKGNGYIDSHINLLHSGQEYRCFTYRAQQTHIVEELKPYHWYKELVLLGARYLQFPEHYVSAIASIESMDDPDAPRRARHHDLIQNMIK
jgi:hypothetical protein